MLPSDHGGRIRIFEGPVRAAVAQHQLCFHAGAFTNKILVLNKDIEIFLVLRFSLKNIKIYILHASNTQKDFVPFSERCI